MSRRFENKTHIGRAGAPITIGKPRDGNNMEAGVEKVDMTTADMFAAILANAPMKSMNDSIQGGRLFDDLQKCKDANFIEIDEGTHAWLKAAAEIVCPPLWRINALALCDFVKDGFEKEPKGNDGG